MASLSTIQIDDESHIYLSIYLSRSSPRPRGVLTEPKRHGDPKPNPNPNWMTEPQRHGDPIPSRPLQDGSS